MYYDIDDLLCLYFNIWGMRKNISIEYNTTLEGSFSGSSKPNFASINKHPFCILFGGVQYLRTFALLQTQKSSQKLREGSRGLRQNRKASLRAAAQAAAAAAVRHHVPSARTTV